MGTPRRQRRKFSRPKHPYNMERITEEKELVKKYGLKNKTEIWRAKRTLGRIRDQAKKMMTLPQEEAERESNEIIDKLNRWGVKVKSIDDILGLQVESILERRLQTIVHRRGLANTPKQARQYINHNHVYIGERRVNVPGQIVLAKQEDLVRLCDKMKVTESAG
jgi:small subunit ribosomal protein S4